MRCKREESSVNRIVILSLNIWNYNEPWLIRRALIADLVSTVSPDMIGFQEIRHDVKRNLDGKNQAEQLAEVLPNYQYIYRPAQRDAERDQWEGLAIFSRYPFKNSSYSTLSRNGSDNRDNHQRIVLHGEFDIGGSRFHFFDTHLSLSREARKRTVREVTAFVDRYTGPKIVVGDFNEVSHEDPIRHVVEESSFCDGWASLHPEEAGLTYSDKNRYIEDESETGGRRIDYVFGKAGATIERCEIAGNTAAADGHFPSDHFGLVAEVSIEETT